MTLGGKKLIKKYKNSLPVNQPFFRRFFQHWMNEVKVQISWKKGLIVIDNFLPWGNLKKYLIGFSFMKLQTFPMNEHLKNSFYFLLKKEIHVIFMNLSVKTFAQGKILVYFYAYAVKKSIENLWGRCFHYVWKLQKKSHFQINFKPTLPKKGGKFWCQISNETFWGNFSSLWFLHGSEFYWVGLGVFGESIFSRSSFSRDVQSDLALWRQLLCSVADQGPLRHSGRSAPTMGPRSLKVIGNWHEWPSLYSSLYTAAASEAATDALWQKQTQNCVLSRSAFETQKKNSKAPKNPKNEEFPHRKMISK